MPLFSKRWRNSESAEEPQSISLTSLKVKMHEDKMVDASEAQNNNNNKNNEEGTYEDQLYRTFPDYSKSMSMEGDTEGMRYRNVNGGSHPSSPFQRHFGDDEEIHKLNEETSWCKDKNIYVNQYRDTSMRFQGFWNLMKLWKGSVMKLVREMKPISSVMHVLYCFLPKFPV
jgi:hypothetical protein